MKHALKLARHGSVFLARVMWIGLMLVFDFFLLLINSSTRRDDHNAETEIPDPFDQMHPNWRFYWDQQRSDLDQ